MREDKKIAEIFGKLVSIDSPSLKERKMADYLKKLFGEIGVFLGRRPDTGNNRIKCRKFVCKGGGRIRK